MATLTIKHDIKHTKNCIQFVKARRETVVDVTAVYVGGDVRTRSGDVWAAKQLPNGNFETVNA